MNLDEHRRRAVAVASIAGLTVLALLSGSPVGAQTADVGLSSVRAQRFGRSSLPNPSVGGADRLGEALAVGDFNGDGVDDLAAGAPLSDGSLASPVDFCGAVVVRYGVARLGLQEGVAPSLLGQFVAGSANPAEPEDFFGSALAACNLNGDAYDDLAVGVPMESYFSGFIEILDGGMVEVYYGTSAGLVPPASASRFETPDLFPFVPDEQANFGKTLACADWNGDGYDDLAVGLPFRDSPGILFAGRVNIFVGSPSGIAPGAVILHQDMPQIDDFVEAGDLFGSALGSGDFDHDGKQDLVVGVPGERIGAELRPGSAHVFYGGAAGAGAGDDELFFESSFGGAPAPGDAFGSAFAAGDFDGDTIDDLAIGALGKTIGGAAQCGLVVEAFGSGAGLTGAGAQRFDQDRVYGSGENEPLDHFGAALAAGDFDGDGSDDLAVGHPVESLGAPSDLEGAVTVFMGRAGAGLDPAPNRHRFFAHGRAGVPGDSSLLHLRFGAALAVGDFDDDGYADLVIGAPSEDEPGFLEVGSVTVLYGSLFADGFETASSELWSGLAP